MPCAPRWTGSCSWSVTSIRRHLPAKRTTRLRRIRPLRKCTRRCSKRWHGWQRWRARPTPSWLPKRRENPSGGPYEDLGDLGRTDSLPQGRGMVESPSITDSHRPPRDSCHTRITPCPRPPPKKPCRHHHCYRRAYPTSLSEICSKYQRELSTDGSHR